MFKKPVNYFYKTTPAPKYKPIQKIWEWQKDEPPENLPLETKKYLKAIKEYKQVNHNFQQDIDNQIFYTPEQIQNSNIQLDPKNLQYQKADIKNFNATDLRQAAKEITKEAINQKANEETNKQILQLQKQINNLKNQQQNKPNQKPENKGENNK